MNLCDCRMIARTALHMVGTGDAAQHLLRARRVAARDGDAGAPVPSQQTVEVDTGLATDVPAAAEQLDVPDAMRGQIPTAQGAIISSVQRSFR